MGGEEKRRRRRERTVVEVVVEMMRCCGDVFVAYHQYWKLKVGVGRPPNGVDPAHFVLSKFNNEEREEVEFIIEDAIDVIELFSKNRQDAVKKASERRIIDVI